MEIRLNTGEYMDIQDNAGEYRRPQDDKLKQAGAEQCQAQAKLD